MTTREADNVTIGVRTRRDWVDRMDHAAKLVGESRMAYIRRAVEERMQREGIAATWGKAGGGR